MQDGVATSHRAMTRNSSEWNQGRLLMEEYLVEEVLQKIEESRTLYCSLVLVVGPPRSGKTTVLQEVSLKASLPLINVNLELSSRMLDIAQLERIIRVPRLLRALVEAPGSDAILLDNIELLFDTSLKQDPLRLFQELSRHKVLVVAWPGSVEKGYLTYAAPGHPEYRRYPIGDLLIVNVGKNKIG